MRSDGIVVASPALDDDLGLAQRVEDLAIEQFVAQASIDGVDGPCTPASACHGGGRCCQPLECRSRPYAD